MPESTTIWFDLRGLEDQERDDFEDLRVGEGLTVDASGDAAKLALDPVTAALVVGSVVALSRLVASLWERWQGGTVVELSANGSKVYRDRSKVPVGFFLVISADGKTVTVEAKDEPKEALERMAEALIKLPVTATVDVIKAAISAASTNGKVE